MGSAWLFLLIRISRSGSWIRGSVLPSKLVRTFLAPMGLMPARNADRILYPPFNQQIKRPFPAQRLSGVQEKDHSTPRIFVEVLEAFPNSRTNVAILELPDGVVPFSISVTPGDEPVCFAHMVHPLPAIADKACHFLRGDGASVGRFQTSTTQRPPFYENRLNFLIGYLPRIQGRERGLE